MDRRIIAFTSTYSYPSISGVWNRVENLALESIKKGYEVHAFTSNIKAGSNQILPDYEVYKGIHIHRYPVKYKISENAYFWDYKKLKKDLLKIKPDIIDCQTYRHPESNFILKLKNKLKAKIFLTTHAPFLEKKLRSWKLNFAVNLYDLFYSKKLDKFDKIIAITKWEIPYLLRLGIRKEKIVYVPNPVPEEFFKIKTKKGKGILFLGRITEVKDLEILIKAFKIIKEKHKKEKLTIIGPLKEPYGAKLTKLIRNLKLNKSVQFFPPIYDLKEKIMKIDSCEIFILPSKREGLPVSLLEAMARSKLVISSKTQGGKELIIDRKNGFLFEIGNEKELADIIFKIRKMKEDEKLKIRKEAKKKAEEFRIDKIIEKLEEVYLS